MGEGDARSVYHAGGSNAEEGTHDGHLGVWGEGGLGAEGGYIYGMGPGGSEVSMGLLEGHGWEGE